MRHLEYMKMKLKEEEMKKHEQEEELHFFEDSPNYKNFQIKNKAQNKISHC